MKRCDASFSAISVNSLVMVLSNVRLLLILLALCLAVGAVPVHQHHQGQDEHQVGDQDGVRDRGKCLCPKIPKTMLRCHQSYYKPVVIWDDNPRVHNWVVTREGESLQGEVLITLRVNITVDLGGIAATLDVDQERGVLHCPLLPAGLVGLGVNLKQFLKCCLQLTLRAGKKSEQQFLLVTFCHQNYFCPVPVRYLDGLWG